MHFLTYYCVSDVNELEKWSEEQLLQMNPSKCKYMIVSKKHKVNSNVGGVQWRLGGMALGEEVDSFKCLGVLHKHLMSSEHISGICSKILGLIYSSITTLHLQHWSSFTWVLFALTLSTCQLWDPYTQNIKTSQLRNLFISHRWDASYEEQTRIVNVPILSKRRLHLKLYKIIHDFPNDVFHTQLTHSSRLARNQTLCCPFAWTNYYYNLFVPSSTVYVLI